MFVPVLRAPAFDQDQDSAEDSAKKRGAEKADAHHADRAEDDVGNRRFLDRLLDDVNDDRRLLKQHSLIVLGAANWKINQQAAI